MLGKRGLVLALPVLVLCVISCGGGGGGGGATTPSGGSSPGISPTSLLSDKAWFGTTWKLMSIGGVDVASRNFKISFTDNNTARNAKAGSHRPNAYYLCYQDVVFSYRDSTGRECQVVHRNGNFESTDAWGTTPITEAQLTLIIPPDAHSYTCSDYLNMTNEMDRTVADWRMEAEFMVNQSGASVDNLGAAGMGVLQEIQKQLMTYILILALSGDQQAANAYAEQSPILQFERE